MARPQDREGVWHEQGILQSLPAKGLPVRWRAPLGSGFSGPAVAKGKVFVMDRVLAEGVRKTSRPSGTIATRRPDGNGSCAWTKPPAKYAWTQSYPCTYSIAYGSGPRATPTVYGDKVYTLGAMGNLLCLDVATGQIVWQKNFVARLSQLKCRSTATPAHRWSMDLG